MCCVKHDANCGKTQTSRAQKVHLIVYGLEDRPGGQLSSPPGAPLEGAFLYQGACRVLQERGLGIHRGLYASNLPLQRLRPGDVGRSTNVFC